VTVKDPVCGREVDPEAVDRVVRRLPNGVGETDPRAGTKRRYQGRWHYFCGLACGQRFASDPARYLDGET
jgi:YHS domain-containing protein